MHPVIMQSHVAGGQQVVVTPEETGKILANPGMGWETYEKASKQDDSLPPWIPSSVRYVRWGWGTLEPQPGKIDYALFDQLLKETHDSGQKLAFRLWCCSTRAGRPYHPAWLKQVGGRELLFDHEGCDGLLPVPDMDDPVVLERHLDFIKRLGRRYDGHPDIDHFDLGSVGWWGEWHFSNSQKGRLPAVENRKKIVDAYLAAFKKTPLLMPIAGAECLTYATERGAGWRADCLGDMRGYGHDCWCHMRVGYPTYIQEAHILDAWKRAPISWEAGWNMRRWVAERWPLRYIFNYALALHGSYFNNKSTTLPAGENVRPEVERFLRRLGYRLVLKELRHAAQARPGARLELAMKWQNVGSAPCYRPYRVAFRLTGDNGSSRVYVGSTIVSHFLPGSIKVFTDDFFKEPKDLPAGEIVSVSDALVVPADTRPGVYTLSVAVVDAVTATPAVRLAIEGRANDGWYPMSQIRVQK
jgi:hypothetical protein